MSESKLIDPEIAKMLLKNAPKYRIALPVFAVKIEFPFAIESLGETIEGEAGDYLAGDMIGQLFRIKKEHFEANYRPYRERKAITKTRKSKDNG